MAPSCLFVCQPRLSPSLPPSPTAGGKDPRLQPSTRGRRCNNGGCCDWHGGERGVGEVFKEVTGTPTPATACLRISPGCRAHTTTGKGTQLAPPPPPPSNLVPVLLLEEPAHLVLVHWRRSFLPGRGCDCFLNNK